MRSLAVLLSVLALGACAPRYGKGRAKAHVAAAPTADAPPEAPVAAAPPPPPPPPPAAPAPAYAQADEDEPAPSASSARKPIAADSVKPRSRDNFYAFSDKEVATLKGKNREFKKLHKELEACTAKSEKAISRREEIPTEIAKLRFENAEKNERAIARLKEEEKQLRADQESNLRACREVESRLTEILRATYGDGATAELY